MSAAEKSLAFTLTSQLSKCFGLFCLSFDRFPHSSVISSSSNFTPLALDFVLFFSISVTIVLIYILCYGQQDVKIELFAQSF